MFLSLLVVGAVLSPIVTGCGPITHIEISHRAVEFFADSSGSLDYKQLIAKHNDALMAGSPYPDAFYPTLCADGKYHSVSEDTHWAPFLNATVNYIRQHYPQPWDEATEKLVVFLFGVVSHQVADILWHSLGIDQGFISTMAAINFLGDYGKAHTTADLGGDVLSMYEFPMNYIPRTQGWYIPTDDLFNIYTELYGSSTAIPKSVIQNCSTELFIERAAEEVAVKELYPYIADKSPFLVDQFESFFLGGLEDMVGWTTRIWEETVTMIDRGTNFCDIPKSTLFVHCNQLSIPRRTGNRYPGKNGFYVNYPRQGLSRDDITVTKYLRGVRVVPKQSMMDKIQDLKRRGKVSKFDATPEQRTMPKNIHSTDVRTPDGKLFSPKPYSKLGWAYATGDLNFDGYDDLVVSAPGYGTAEYSSSPQEGRVYIIYGTADGIPMDTPANLDDLETSTPRRGQIMKGFGTAQSRYGSSLAVLDVNLDGALDLVIGAPTAVQIGVNPLDYHGWVFVYFGIPAKHIVASGAANITISCEKTKYCNFGFSLATGDINHDGHDDLIMGTPFAPAGGKQRGFISGYISDQSNTGYQYFDVTTLGWQKFGDQDYGWYGYNLYTHKRFGNELLFVSQPQYSNCTNNNCSSGQDIQSVGRLHMYDLGPNPGPDTFIDGVKTFDQLSSSVDVGMPFGNRSYIMAVSGTGEAVDGSLAGVPFLFKQAGQVHLINITSSRHTQTSLFSGDRQYGKFGSKVKFLDINGDVFDDLVIGASFRSDDITEEVIAGEEGQVFVYFGGSTFPGNDTGDCGNSLVSPCPQYTSSMTLRWTTGTTLQEKIRFGTNFALLKSKSKKQLFVTAQHSSEYARLSGGIGIFNL